MYVIRKEKHFSQHTVIHSAILSEYKKEISPDGPPYQ